MDDHDWLAERFEEHRSRLRAVAYHMLGSLTEADDAVQETWLRLSRSDPGGCQFTAVSAPVGFTQDAPEFYGEAAPPRFGR